MAEPLAGKPLQFVPLSSEIELPFYSALFSMKLEHDMLNDSARAITGAYEARVSRPEDSCKVQIAGNSLHSQYTSPRGSGRADGTLRNTNTWEDFKNLDRAGLLKHSAKQIWDAIKDGTINSVPSLLSSFILISFADLKKFNYTYWFAFPALHSSWVHASEVAHITPQESTALVESVDGWQYRVKDTRQHGFFVAKKVLRSVLNEDGDEATEVATQNTSFTEFGNEDEELPYVWVVDSIGSFDRGFFDNVAEEDRFVGFIDSSNYPRNPGWQLRNLLVLIQRRFKMNKVNILCYRDVHNHRDAARSIIMTLQAVDTIEEPLQTAEMPKVTGWEKNGATFKYKRVSLAAYMDPLRIADQSVDLNLKLMKWRLAPNLILENISKQKCLLLGAGTLGSYVSRNLMAWGIKNITFVDYGKVSFSNPVRQPLFVFKDCLDGGSPKAPTAASALMGIYPGVKSVGHQFTVPMIGHAMTDVEKTKQDFEKLQGLIEDHDVIFLLMDTRESRWLPTVMAKAAGKLVLNAALGFDSYVVMRHGTEIDDSQVAKTGQKPLGCYFCNDVVAPADSMRDQTLDQQCTVTRPGIAPIASAMAVELFASLLQHPLQGKAPAPKTTGLHAERDPPNHPLGTVPHQVRGFISSFQNVVLRGEAYPNCSACSPVIVDAYRRDGWDFVQRALREKDYVAELSGLAELHRKAEQMSADIEWDSEGGSAGCSSIGSDGEGELL
ncbi:uncharacterized protein BROUX77_007810 [Berkeleyomyces rouxiae]|uniref:uncharacterized protein n=1 Tax=Berkeleyomyces rouxiae TaxID=2035830 RepID=UPI003B7D1BFF